MMSMRMGESLEEREAWQMMEGWDEWGMRGWDGNGVLFSRIVHFIHWT